MTTINNNNAALALSKLNKNTNQLTNDLKKIASGLRINSAKDDASGYAISESMQVRLRGLEKCEENTVTGGNMLKVAAGAVEQQLELMNKLRENALKASDDTYSQQDRDVLQSETTHLLMQSNSISWETNYNGIRLLDGITDTMEKVVTREWESTSVNNFNPSLNNSLTQQMQSQINTTNLVRVSSYNTANIRRINSQRLLGANNQTVDLDPTRPPLPNTINGLFPLSNNTKSWPSGLIYGYTPFNPSERVTASNWNIPMTTRQITYPIGMPGRFDPPIYNLDPMNLGEEILYDGNGVPQFSSVDLYGIKDSLGRLVRVNIYDYGNEIWPLAVSINGQDISYGASGWSVDINFAAATLNGNPLELPRDLNNQSITVFCEYCNQYIGIKFETNRPAGTGQVYKPSDETNRRTGNEYKDARVYAVGIGNEPQTASEVMRNVFLAIQDANAADGITSSPNANYVTLGGHSLSIYYDANNDVYSFRQAGYPPIFYNGGIGTLYGGGEEEYGGPYVPPDEPDPPTPDPPTPDPPTPDPPTPDPSGRWVERVTYIPRKYPYKNIIIQSDTKASLHTRLQLPNTTLDALFPPQNTSFTLEPKETDYPVDWPPEYDQLTLDEKKNKWRNEIWPYAKPGANASGTCVRIKESAIKFLKDIDNAIKYLLDSSTTLGAQINRLEAMKNNLTIAHEQTMNSESTIKDVDMAKSITNYHKSNILAQAAQSMLSQANKANSEMLNLLQ